MLRYCTRSSCIFQVKNIQLIFCQSSEESIELLYFHWKQTGYSMAVVEHGQPVKKDIIENKTWIQWYVFEKGNSNGPLNHGKEGKTMFYVIQCRFSEFLVQLCIKKRFSLGPSRNITTLCRKIAFFGVRAEILLSRNQGVLDSRAGPFLGYVQIYSFLEKYSPLTCIPLLRSAPVRPLELLMPC